MIRKLLIANRGEIACRIARTCDRLGIATVAVYSDADRNALHVRAAREAVRIGPADAASSYLDPAAIIAAAQQTGADAIHPGYGFLSERTMLPLRCAELGLTWIGPSANAIERMGSKIEAKRIAAACGVPCVPGVEGDDDETLARDADTIGFPLLVKASAGGGGRGMRRVDRAEDLADALRSARAEALLGFGNGALLIERLIARPRHIEVQLAGDKHGNLVHLFERECSIQRNYQKLVEEAPAPNLTDRTRAAMFEAALKLGHAIAYDSLGTVEFILEAGDEQPYFLEMNTRLQVEHPVTEAITGLDLVEWQIRIADGQRLPRTQQQIVASGAAIEVRLNAESPAAGFRPETGAIAAISPPPSLRFETGVAAGSQVTAFYDSMIAKLIASGADRTDAVQRLQAGLADLALFGLPTNQAFLRDIIAHPNFIAGRLTTRFLDEAFPGGWRPDAPTGDPECLAASCAWMLQAAEPAPHLGPWSALGGFRILAPAGRPGRVTLCLAAGAQEWTVTIEGAAGRYRLTLDATTYEIEAAQSADILTATIAGPTHRYRVWRTADRIILAADAQQHDFTITPRVAKRPAPAQHADEASPLVKSPMPGRIAAIEVIEGQSVAQGDTVVVLEAMKMLLRLPAPIAGRVGEIMCTLDQIVPAGTFLMRLEPSSPTI